MTNKTLQPTIEKGGFAIYEDDYQILLVNHQLGGIYTLNFILILITVILGINGAFFIMSNIILGLSFILISAISGYFVYVFFKILKEKKADAPSEKSIVAIIDLNENLFLNSKGERLASMNEVKITKGFNITSSSPSIVAKWGNGKSKTLFKFNGLIGGSDYFISYFKQKGYWN